MIFPRSPCQAARAEVSEAACAASSLYVEKPRSEAGPVMGRNGVPSAPVTHVVGLHLASDRCSEANLVTDFLGGVDDDVRMASGLGHIGDVALRYGNVKACCYVLTAMRAK